MPATLFTGQKVSSLQASIIAILAFSFFALGDAMGKWLQSEGYSKYFILVVTQIPSLIFLSTYMLRKKGWRGTFQMRYVPWHILRALSIVSLTFFLFLALERIPLADLYSIVFCSPFITAIGAYFFFNEKQSLTDWVAIMIGFLGILLIAQPDYSGINIAYIFAFCQALSISAASLLVRKIGEKEHPFVFVIYANGAVILLNFIPALNTSFPEAVTSIHIIIFMAYMAILPLAIMCLSMAYASAPQITNVLPFIYIQIVWGAGIGYLVFDDIPSWNVITGASIIIACGLYLIFHHKRRKNKT